MIFLIFLLFPISSNEAKIILINNDDNPPYPPIIEGPTNCTLRKNYDYYITVSDPDNDRLIELYIEFGDGTNMTKTHEGTSCNKGWRSGQTLWIYHKWEKTGDFTIKAKVKDIKWSWSDWGYLDVKVKFKSTILSNILQNFLLNNFIFF